jgi:dUTP pyrophosphatase
MAASKSCRREKSPSDLTRYYLKKLLSPKVEIHVLPGGMKPVRMTKGAIGYDCFARAVVCAKTMDPNNKLLRRNLYDFVNPPEDPVIAQHVEHKDGMNQFRIDPGEQFTVGIGFVTRMPFPLMYWVAPRSGLSSRYGITISNAPGTVDPDYRGEAGANLRNNGTSPFYLGHGMRIVQILFQWVVIPGLTDIATHEELMDTERGAGGFGHTGQ